MSDDVEQPEIPKDPRLAGIFAIHTLLGVIGSVLTGAAVTVIHRDDWRAFAGLSGLAISNAAIALAKGWLSPRQRAIMENHDPMPVAGSVIKPPPIPIVAGVIETAEPSEQPK